MNRRQCLRALLGLAGFGLANSVQLSAQEPSRSGSADKEQGGFAETRTGDVPAGAAELVTPEAERAIERALAWLAKQQNSNGSFGSGIYKGNIAVTSLAALAFMANGSSPGRGPYGSAIDRALLYVAEKAEPSGFLAVASTSSHGPMYSHGFGTLFLAEAYGMTHRADLRDKLQRAVRLIVTSQNPEGGWRYQPVPVEADLSVTICQINALRAARNAGVFVPKETVERCIKYVKQSQNPDGGFKYMLQGGPSEFPRSAAGVVALYSASVYDAKEVDRGIAYLHRSLPRMRVNQRNRHYFYGHYYAAQAMWIRGGEDWNKWYPLVQSELVDRQSSTGSWTDDVCSEYATAMALIVLQIPNNCLPIFQR